MGERKKPISVIAPDGTENSDKNMIGKVERKKSLLREISHNQGVNPIKEM